MATHDNGASPLGLAGLAGLGGTPGTPLAEPVYCDRCGEPATGGSHERCASARALEPPRYCSACRRRLVVQVVPTGWHASCVEHGVTTG